jgi:diguanylate cyclase (GGDEF)-like protein
MNVHTLKFRLIALGGMLIIVGVLVRSVVVLPFVQTLWRELVMAQQSSIATYIARDIEESVDARRTLIKKLADAVPVSLLQQPTALAAWLADRQHYTGLFDDSLLALPSHGVGVLASTSAWSGSVSPDFPQEQWFQDVLLSREPVISKPLRAAIGGGPIIIMAAPILDTEGRVTAILAGVSRLDAPGFLQALQVNRLGKTGGFLLISPADKVFVSASDPSMVLAPVPAPGINLLHDRAMAGYRGVGITVNAKGVEEVSAMESVRGTGWFVVARIPTAEAFRPLSAMHELIFFSSLLVLVVVIGLLLLVLPRILRPLADAAKAMRDMAEGRRSMQALPVPREDEVGNLMRGFNALVVRLQEQEAELKESEACMAFLAHHDSLTGMYNRQMLEERLQHALAQAAEHGTRFALLFCDLDRFKPINDEFGHGVGDAVLIQAASRLSESCRRTDTAARLGGDEFVVLLTDLADARHDAQAIAEKCREKIAAPYLVGDKAFTLTVSIGVALYQGAGVSASQLMSQADIAMYQAKRAGKNQIRFFSDGGEDTL